MAQWIEMKVLVISHTKLKRSYLATENRNECTQCKRKAVECFLILKEHVIIRIQNVVEYICEVFAFVFEYIHEKRYLHLGSVVVNLKSICIRIQVRFISFIPCDLFHKLLHIPESIYTFALK